MRMLILLCILGFLFVWANKSPNQNFSEALADISKVVTQKFGNDVPHKTVKLEKEGKPEKIKPEVTVKVEKSTPPDTTISKKVLTPKTERPVIRQPPKKPGKFKDRSQSVHKKKPASVTERKVRTKVKPLPSANPPASEPTPPPLPKSRFIKKQPKPAIQPHQAPRHKVAQTSNRRPRLTDRPEPPRPDPVIIKKLKSKEKNAINNALKTLQSIGQ